MPKRSTLEQRLDWMEGLLQNRDVHSVDYLMAALRLEMKELTDQVWGDAGEILKDMQQDSVAFQKGLEEGRKAGEVAGRLEENGRVQAVVRRAIQSEKDLQEFTEHDGEEALKQLLRHLQVDENGLPRYVSAWEWQKKN